MKVYDRNLTGASAAETGRTSETHPSDRAGGTSTAGNAGDGDRVELSQTLNSLAHALAVDGSSQAARVRDLTAQYQSGLYQPDSAVISQALVQEALAGSLK